MAEPTPESIPPTTSSTHATTKSPHNATDSATHDADVDADVNSPPTPTPKGWKFWLIFICLTLTAFVSALEGSIVSTALPSISRALGSSENYIWVVNVYYLTK